MSDERKVVPLRGVSTPADVAKSLVAHADSMMCLVAVSMNKDGTWNVQWTDGDMRNVITALKILDINLSEELTKARQQGETA